MRSDCPLRWLSGLLLVLGLLFAACGGERSNEDRTPAPPLPAAETSPAAEALKQPALTVPEAPKAQKKQESSGAKPSVIPATPASASEEAAARGGGQGPATKKQVKGRLQEARRPSGTTEEPDMFDLLTGQGEGEEVMKDLLGEEAPDPRAVDVVPGPPRKKE